MTLPALLAVLALVLPTACSHNRTEGGSGVQRSGAVRSAESVFVMGEVQTPGRRVLASGDNLAHVIAASGGFTEKADKRQVRLKRGGRTVKTLDCTSLDSGAPSPAMQSVRLRQDDMLVVPSAR